MKYVFVSYNFSPTFNAPESWFERTEMHAGILESLSKENTVINVKQINYEGTHIYNGVDYRFVNCNRKKTHFPIRLNRYIKKLNPDIVFVHGLHNPLQIIQLRLILKKKTKIIAQNHAEHPYGGFKKYLQRMADVFVNAYFFPSHAMGMEWIKRGNLANPEKIFEVMEVSSSFYPIAKSLAKEKTGVTGNPVFLWVLRLNPVKDPLTVVKAFLQFVEHKPSARLYMIYHTEDLLAQVKEVLDRSTKKSAVTLVGKVQHDELLYWFNSADILISGSHHEGSNTALCEAMSCGCMPLVTDIPSFRMMTDNGNCGMLYEAGNQEALVNTLMQTSHLNIAEKQRKSREYFISNLSFDAIANRIKEIAASL